MRWLGRTDLRVLFAILITALIPLVVSAAFARTIVARISATAFQPEFGLHLDQALTVYADLAKAMKVGLRHEAMAMANAHALRESAGSPDEAARRAGLAGLAAGHPQATSLRVERCTGEATAAWLRPTPIDLATERAFSVRVELHPNTDPSLIEADSAEPACAPDGLPLRFVATFAAPRARFDELEEATAFAQAYHEI